MSGEAAATVLWGVPRPPEAVERRRRTAIELNLGQYLQPCPCPNGSRPWSADELALLGTMTDHALALRRSRSVNAVRIMREKRQIVPHPDSQAWLDMPGAGLPWTDEDDDLVMRLLPAVASERLGRSLQAVYNRRREIRRMKATGGPGG
jgi:hypothetical protein